MTILFADLVGYTRLSSTLDVEVVHGLVRPLMDSLRQVCLSMGGVVPSIEGDGFMAVFGARRSQEDDVDRALLAAARMQAVVSERRRDRGDVLPLLRVGVNTGEVLVSPSWEPCGFSIVGDPVNVASRLCALAPEGGVLVAGDTAALVPGLPVLGQLRELQVRNRSTAVRAIELDSDELLAVPHRERAWASPFVGRSAACAALDAAVASNRPVLLLGEPGIGKTRLATEWARGRPGHVLHMRFGLHAWDDASPLAALLEDVPTHRMDVVLGSGVRRRRIEQLRGRVVDAWERDDRVQQLTALGEGLAELAVQVPLTVCLDDVHAATDEEAACIEGLVKALVSAGAAVVLVSREPIDGLDVAGIELGPLDVGELHELISALLPDADDDLEQLLAQRTGGNPFFVEQSVQLVREHGAVEARERLHAVPTFMRLFVASRIDLLGEADKAVLRAAAVLTEDIDLDVLLHLSGSSREGEACVERLVERGLLRWEAASAPGRPDTLEFCHQLFRDVAYEEITRVERIAVHRAAAEWYGTLPVVDVLASEARHLESTLSLGGGDCALAGRTVEVLVFWARSVLEERPLAAEQAISRAAGVIEQWAQCSFDRLGLVLVRAHLAEQRGDLVAAQEDAEEAEVLAREAGHEGELAVAGLVRGRVAAMLDPGHADAVLDEVASRFEALGDLTGLARVAVERARARASEGLRARVDAYEAAYHVAVRAGDRRLTSMAAQDLALHTSLLDVREGPRWLAVAKDLVRPDDAVGRARLGLVESLAHLQRDELEQARITARAVTSAAREVGATQTSITALLLELEAAALTGHVDRAGEILSDGRAVAASRLTGHLTLDLDMHEALLRGHQGEPAAALHDLERLQGECVATSVDYERQRCFFFGLVALNSGRFTLAAETLAEVLRIDTALGSEGLLLRSRSAWIAASIADGKHVPLGVLSEHRALLRAAGADVLERELALRLRLADLLQGHRDSAGEPADGPLALQVQGLTERDPALLEAAARAYGALGTSVWEAQCRIWAEALGGPTSDEAVVLLDRLGAADLIEPFRAQVQLLR